MGQGQAQPARPRPYHGDPHRKGPGIARRQSRADLGGLPADPVGGSLRRRGADELPRPVAQLHGARQGSLRRPRGGRGRRDLAGDRRGGLRADPGRLPRTAARHRRRRGDEARRAAVARRPLHPGCRSQADPPLQRRQDDRLHQGRHRRRVPRGRRHDRAALFERAGASGLYRAACLCRLGRRRRADHDLELEPGPVHGARLLRQTARHRHLADPRDPGRDRRRLWRQDPDLSRTSGLGDVAQDRPAGQDGDEPRRGVPRHRAGGGCRHRGQARRQEGWHG